MRTEESVKLLETVAFAEDCKFYLQYMVVCSEDPLMKGKELSRVYSLIIIESSQVHGRESAFVYDISRDRERAEQIAALLCKETVMPCTVYEVLDEIL